MCGFLGAADPTTDVDAMSVSESAGGDVDESPRAVFLAVVTIEIIATVIVRHVQILIAVVVEIRDREATGVFNSIGATQSRDIHEFPAALFLKERIVLVTVERLVAYVNE